MGSPILALVWEQWQQVRFMIAFVISITFLASWSLHAAMIAALPPEHDISTQGIPENAIQSWTEMSTFIAASALLLLLPGLLFTHSSLRDLRMALPQRMLVLPVSNLQLAWAQVAFRFATVFCVAVILGLLIAAVDRAFVSAIAPFTGIALISYAYISAIAHTVGARSPIAAFVFAALTTTPVTVAVVFVDSGLTGATGAPWALSIAFIALCGAISILGIALLRGAPSFQELVRTQAFRPSARLLRTSLRDREIFHVEWKRTWWLMPSLAAGMLVLSGTLFIVNLFRTTRFDDVVRWAGEMLFGVGPPVCCFILGLLFLARDHRDSVNGVARFTWTHPTSVQQVVLHRMRAVTYSMLLTFVVPGILVTIFTVIAFGLPSFGPLSGTLLAVFASAAFLCLAWCIVWVPYVPLAYMLLFSSYSTATNYRVWGPAEDFWLLILPSLIYLAVFTFVALACWKRRVFEWRIVLRFLAIGAVLFIIALMLISNAFRPIDYPPNENLAAYRLAALALSLMPLFAFLAQGVLLDRIRHGALTRRLPARSSRFTASRSVSGHV
ncbi:MAG: hypothetical protein HUU46_25080 [Candidatus Hydrogenedentes bacterium]|nr:hypothetical protein [Candidatus Hydrogenedentota bacterium]